MTDDEAEEQSAHVHVFIDHLVDVCNVFMDYLLDFNKAISLASSTSIEKLLDMHARLLEYRKQFETGKAQWAGGDQDVLDMYTDIIETFPVALQTVELRIAILRERPVHLD